MDKRKEILYSLGTLDEDIESLLEYTKNEFSPCTNQDSDEFLNQWQPVMVMCESVGAATAINRYLSGKEQEITFMAPNTVHIELYNSIGGIIPVITTENTVDFESMVRNIVFKGRDVANISEMGAMFAFGKINRFIILSNKPYSNVSAERMELSETVWKQKSLSIRKDHECTHYYTKRFFGSSRNNLHDELIADFNGLYKAFGEYKAEWFLKFLGLSQDSDDIHGRFKVYVDKLSGTASAVVKKLAVTASYGLEKWTKTDEFAKMSETERIDYLCKKDLLEYVTQ